MGRLSIFKEKEQHFMTNHYPEFVIKALNKVMRQLYEDWSNNKRVKLFESAFRWNSSYKEYYDLYFSREDKLL